MQAPVVLKYKVKPQKKKLEERGRRYGMSEKQQILEKRSRTNAAPAAKRQDESAHGWHEY